MDSETAGEQSIPVGVVHDVAGRSAGAGERAGHQVRPRVEIARGIADDRGLARRPRRRVQPEQPFARHGEHAKGIVVAQIRFQRERKSADVGERLEIPRTHARGVEFLAIMRKGVGALQRVLEAARLQRREGPARHRLGVAVEHERAGAAARRLGAHRAISKWPRKARFVTVLRFGVRDPRSFARLVDQTTRSAPIPANARHQRLAGAPARCLAFAPNGRMTGI
jgi:hypothetical protein